ncbi:hypothetical protein D6C97_07948 [Aureobasidium pullulans]|nr:hypothetical protein D6C97_07948 [Aureobasidium pullulans]
MVRSVSFTSGIMTDAHSEAIAGIVGVVGCTDDVARRWLKVKNNDADAALNAIFDNEDLSKAESTSTVTWNENDFSAGRDGTAAFGPQNYAFNEQNLRPLGQSAAPTRGNSPANSFRQPANRDDEDADLQKAIAASQGQTGVTLPNTNFKPATENHYDPRQWSLTIADDQQASEIIPDLEPHERKNEPGEPRFLKQLPSGDYLPNLLTIAHSIPFARKALLAPHKSYSSYGSDSEWWKGHGIRLPKIVSTVSGAPLEPATTSQDEMIAEMQRLMALLDESTRSYGSADTLVRLAENNSGCILDRVLQKWENAYLDTMEQYYNENKFFVFHSLIGTTNPEGMNTSDLYSLPLFVTSGPGNASVDLASIMDDTLWDTDVDDVNFYDNFIDSCAQVLPIRLTQNDTSKETLNVIIPPAFYVDKYLKKNADATREVRKQIAHGKKKIEKIELAEFKLKNYRHAQKGDLDTESMLQHAQNYFSGESRKNLIEEREGAGAGGDTDIPLPLEHHSVIAEQLHAVCVEIDSKLKALEQEKEKARKALAELSQETGLAQESLQHRYSLRGVSTKSQVTYLLRPRDPSDTSMVDDEDAPAGTQWWRIEYDVQVNGAKVNKSKSSQDDVIRAVELEHNQALLVYASDAALSSEHHIELTPALKEFIRHDDENFDSEMQMNGYGHVNVYPANVGQRRGSADSTIANFGNDEDLPPAYEDGDVEYGRIPIDDGKDITMNGGGESPPAHEIRLDNEDVQHSSGGDKGGVEMIEKTHEVPSTLYRFGNDGSKTAKTGNDDVMTGITAQEEEVDLIDFKD